MEKPFTFDRRRKNDLELFYAVAQSADRLDARLTLSVCSAESSIGHNGW